MAWDEALQANFVVSRPLEFGFHIHCPQFLAGIRFVGASTAKAFFLLLRWRIREGRQIGFEGRLAVTGSLAWEMLVLMRHLRLGLTLLLALELQLPPRKLLLLLILLMLGLGL